MEGQPAKDGSYTSSMAGGKNQQKNSLSEHVKIQMPVSINRVLLDIAMPFCLHTVLLSR